MTLVSGLGIVDMIFFVSSMAIGFFIGVYFGYFSTKESNAQSDYYLFGGRNMGIFPISLSSSASVLSSIAMIGIPAEVYVYGIQIAYLNIVSVFVALLYTQQILPVFHAVQGLSPNEYFEKRFDRRVRLLISVLYFFSSVLTLPIVMFLPGLAYEQVTGYNVHLVTPVVCFVCIFCTSIGGIKAVVWTDAIQMILILISTILLAVKGTFDVGGLGIVWERAAASGRLEPPYVDWDPTVRQTIFSLLIGGFFVHLKVSYLNQGQVQRHQALSTVSQAKITVWIFVLASFVVHLLSKYLGLVISAYYFRCDPISVKIARTRDQIVPLFVLQAIQSFPGLLGIFLSGVFSASLSTFSTALNTLSGVFVEDFIRGWTLWNPSDRQSTWIMRIFVIVLGIIIIGLIFVVEKLGMAYQFIMSVEGITSGPLLTVFFLALFFPWVTPTAALIGAGTAIVSVMPLVIGAQYSISRGWLLFPAKPVSLEGCTQMFNLSSEFMSSVKVPLQTQIPYGPTKGDVAYPFRISHLWYAPISLTFGLTAAVLVTIFTSKADLRSLDRRLIAPISRRWLPRSCDDSPTRGKHVLVTNLPIELQIYGQQ